VCELKYRIWYVIKPQQIIYQLDEIYKMVSKFKLNNFSYLKIKKKTTIYFNSKKRKKFNLDFYIIL